jgi:N-acetylglutamate synthase-like GNAT family acetyltransferase
MPFEHITLAGLAPVRIRAATEYDQRDIEALVHSERLNPNDLDWRRFVVAGDGVRIVGAVQLRRHADGSRELGSLVVHPQARGQGLAARLIDALLANEEGRVWMITNGKCAARYARWGFVPIEPRAAPAPVRRNYRIGRLAGGLLSLLQGRCPARLVILERAPLRQTAER